MCNAPSERNIVPEQLCQSFRCRPGCPVPPCPEGNQQLPFFVKCHITVHHRAESDSADGGKCRIIFLFHILCHFPVAVPKPCPDIIQSICPDPVIQTVFPFMVAGRNRMMVFIHQHGFNSCRTEFQTKNRSAALNHFSDIFVISHSMRPPVYLRNTALFQRSSFLNCRMVVSLSI